MPPAISDDEASQSGSSDAIPAKKVTAKAESEDEDDIAEEDEEEGDTEEYVVEKIMGHKFAGKELYYQVKWQGYNSKDDMTWEPEENLETAPEALAAYFKKIGGRPVLPKKEAKRKISTSAAATPIEKEKGGRGRKKMKRESSGSATSEAPPKFKREWQPPKGSWENEVMAIDTVEEKPDPTTGEKTRHAYIVWNNGNKSVHRLATINQKCPQKMLQYYEQHLVFKTTDPIEPRDPIALNKSALIESNTNGDAGE